jgi:ATP-binding cassette subfamily B protein
MHSLFWPISDIACSFQLLVGYFIAATMAINGEITVGTYVAYAGLVGWLIWPMRNLGRLIVQTSTGLVSYGRVMEIIKHKSEPLTEGEYLPSGPVQGELIFDKVGFAYENNPPVLEDISFACKPGQVVALLGSTGSGKSSLVNLLPRFYNYTTGSIKLDGVELNLYPKEYLRSQVGIVEQEPFLFSRSIRENITYGVGRDVPQIDVENAATSAAVHEVIVSFPDEYNTLVGEKGVTLSGGQKQRVTIARTILKDSHLLILDDSTSSVDTETEASIRESLMSLTPKRTTFIIAHRIQSVMNADLILVMDKGKIIQKGTHEELFAQDGMYRKIFDLQTRIDQELELEISQGLMKE